MYLCIHLHVHAITHLYYLYTYVIYTYTHVWMLFRFHMASHVHSLWISNAVLMGSLWILHGSPVGSCSACLCIPYAFTIDFQWISKWIFYGFPVASHSLHPVFDMNFHWISSGLPMDPWILLVPGGFHVGSPMNYKCIPVVPHGFAMDSPWIFCGFPLCLPMYFTWSSNGFPHGSPKVSLWLPIDSTLYLIWISNGFPVAALWIPMDSF